MKIEYLRFTFDGSGGRMYYKNAQGEKRLDFGICENTVTEFPEEGYPDMQMNVPCPGNKFPCAVSAAWLEPNKLGIRVQMIGKHLGGLYITVGFTPDLSECGVYMIKNTNCFLNEYNGWAFGKRKTDTK